MYIHDNITDAGDITDFLWLLFSLVVIFLIIAGCHFHSITSCVITSVTCTWFLSKNVALAFLAFLAPAFPSGSSDDAWPQPMLVLAQ